MKHWNEMSSRWHEDYEQGRPSYPASVVRIPGLSATDTVLELGAGTGKLTRLLVAEYGRVTAVEPDPGMRRWLTERCPQADVVAATAEALPLANDSIGAVFSAEAFHWFDHERALVEIARVLEPGGVLVLMWNRPAGSPEPPIGEAEALLEPHWPRDIHMPLDLDPSRLPHARDWPRAFEGSSFESLRESLLPNPHVVDVDGLMAFFGSMGWIDALPDEQGRSLLADVRSRLTATQYRLPFETHVHTTRLANPRSVGPRTTSS